MAATTGIKWTAHFFKQKYDANGKLCYDGLLDGECRQAWPVVER